MNNLFYIIIIILSLTGFNKTTLAETNQDCSQYSAKTFSGLVKKMRCKKGLPPEKGFFDKLQIKTLKPKNDNEEIKTLDCSNTSTKTIAGLIKTMRCRNK